MKFRLKLLTISYIIIGLTACNSDNAIERSLKQKDTIQNSKNNIEIEISDSVKLKQDTVYKQSYVSPASMLRVYPVDEATKDSTFFNFRETLKTSITERNTAYIKSIIHEEAVGIWGKKGNKNEFIELYFGNEKHVEDAKFWHIMSKIIGKGGKFAQNGNDRFFIAPYAAANNLPKKLVSQICDCFVVMERKVPVYSYTNFDSKIIDTLSYDFILTNLDKNHDGWLYVKSRKPGYFKAEVFWPFDYRVFFQKENGKWYIKYLVDGSLD